MWSWRGLRIRAHHPAHVRYCLPTNRRLPFRAITYRHLGYMDLGHIHCASWALTLMLGAPPLEHRAVDLAHRGSATSVPTQPYRATYYEHALGHSLHEGASPPIGAGQGSCRTLGGPATIPPQLGRRGCSADRSHRHQAPPGGAQFQQTHLPRPAKLGSTGAARRGQRWRQ